MSEAQRERQPLLPHEDVEDVMVSGRSVVLNSLAQAEVIDTPLTLDALTAPDLTYTLIRPLEEKYNSIQRGGNKSVVFCFLLNRVHFIRDQNLTTGPLSSTRAMLCEILAIRILRDNGNSMLDLALALTTSWPVWSGADAHTIAQAREERDDDLEERVGNAIEMAIISKAKRFIKSSPCQKVIDGIWIGKCVYQAESSHSILSDTYKRTPIHFYDPHKAPLLDHYRLKVPAIRSVLEYINFLILFILFVVAIEMNERHRLNIPEILFMVYALGFTLEKVAAMQEHGIKVYFKGTWNGFDLAFVTAYCIYVSFRLYGVLNHRVWAQNIGIDFLAVIACLMFPRLAFVTLKNNLMVLSLRAMMMQFVVLMMIAAFCFGGFLLSRKQARHSVSTIAWWMLDLWFGLDASGFDRASEFDIVFGPVLMVTYACLSNTLLLTVLVSILSNTFAKINEDAAAEAMFRRAVSTIEGVKADSLFSYQPPVNLLALCVLLPSSYILSPRWFHKVNVFMIRATNFPVLLVIAWYERQAKKNSSIGFYDTLSAAAEKIIDTLPRHLKKLTLFEGLAGSGADIDVIFELEDELDSALDTREYDELPSLDLLHRRSSSKKSVRRPSSNASSHMPPPSLHPSNGSSHPPHPPPLPPSNDLAASPPKLQIPPSPPRPSPHTTNRPLPGSPTSAVPRRRVNSVLGRPDISQSYSPLAQVFQPLLVDEDIPEEDVLNAPPLISYGPASRRRLTSMQSMHRRPTNDLLHLHTMGPRKFPSTENEARQESLSEGPLSESPNQRQEPLTAEQLEEDNDNNGGTLQWTRRMDKIERSQKRIEELLVQLTKMSRESEGL
ncbi:hypothetical protein SERLA73DRAFT_75638 [Serpula lacrymans var. lacrymans S7.3]|uniref:Ion transport domain-containing protein n=1 Tax=Serpula lacrymans var. lacrymans (strain S7.3) TaxID=936435 RepID=F8Q3R8_SERL3|nr:hypothetical protein SERLA73DRAFT_75638 [Serpula lacrymans var. lacrymans S7.3]